MATQESIENDLINYLRYALRWWYCVWVRKCIVIQRSVTGRSWHSLILFYFAIFAVIKQSWPRLPTLLWRKPKEFGRVADFRFHVMNKHSAELTFMPKHILSTRSAFYFSRDPRAFMDAHDVVYFNSEEASYARYLHYQVGDRTITRGICVVGRVGLGQDNKTKKKMTPKTHWRW